MFNGPEGTAKEIAIQYQYFRRSLAAIGQTPAQVQISPRRAWQVKLASGLTLELGREHVEARLARFVARLRAHASRSSGAGSTTWTCAIPTASRCGYRSCGRSRRSSAAAVHRSERTGE